MTKQLSIQEQVLKKHSEFKEELFNQLNHIQKGIGDGIVWRDDIENFCSDFFTAHLESALTDRDRIAREEERGRIIESLSEKKHHGSIKWKYVKQLTTHRDK